VLASVFARQTSFNLSAVKIARGAGLAAIDGAPGRRRQQPIGLLRYSPAKPHKRSNGAQSTLAAGRQNHAGAETGRKSHPPRF
jgi:hypothetical protein